LAPSHGEAGSPTPHRHLRVPVFGRAAPPFGSEFVSIEATGGLVLLAATIAALVWANTATAGYRSWWTRSLTVGPGDVSIRETLQHWVNAGVMTVFFFVVGLEIKRELVAGELRDRRAAALPAIAAVSGMAVPAALYVAVNAGGSGGRGWGIPIATDIAFAVGVLALLGPRVPSSLKLFLLTLAIVDDVGAIVVIALFYSGGVDIAWLAVGIAAVAVILAMTLGRVARPAVYLVPGVLLWVALHEAGIEATLAGVVLGLLTPMTTRRGAPVLERLEHHLHPWSSFLVVPLFALANVGVVLRGDVLRNAWSSRITIGIVVGLVVGKLVGVLGGTWLAVRAGIGRLPSGAPIRQIAGVAALAGIGFTVSLFVADLSFGGARLNDAKVGILVASIASAVLGLTLLVWSGRAAARADTEARPR
jgi:NhaA family Na+:H+ antiporter